MMQFDQGASPRVLQHRVVRKEPSGWKSNPASCLLPVRRRRKETAYRRTSPDADLEVHDLHR
jgi:hypothetical protein